MVKKTVLKVHINCPKCKKKLLKAVSSLQDKIEVDEAKGTLTVTGDADPYEVVVRTRKAGKFAEVVSIGPPPAPPKPDAQQKTEEKKPEQVKFDPCCRKGHYVPHYCPACHPAAVVHVSQCDEPSPSCCIL